MQVAAICFTLSLVLGPGIFWYVGRVHYKGPALRYPIGYHDSIGDGLFLSLHNAWLGVLIYRNSSVIDISLLGYAFLLSLVFTFVWNYWAMNIYSVSDWIRPRMGHFSAGGWYHAVYMLVASFLVNVGYLAFGFEPLLTLFFSAYVCTAILTVIVYRHI